jgi:KUP system potassium uptake protein
MTGNPDVVPNALLHNLKHNKVLHERVLLMTVRVGDVPFVPEEGRVGLEELGKGFWKATVAYGFMDQPDIPKALERCRAPGLDVDLMLTSFFLARETLILSPRRQMSRLAERLFILLAAAALPATAYFRVPPNRVVELGTQVEV